MRPASVFQLPQHFARAAQVTAVLAKYGLADWLGTVSPGLFRRLLRGREVHTLSEGSREARIRKALTELGTTFIKLGQILSTRADVIGVDLAAELTKLQDQTPPDPPAVVFATIEAELGRPASELFAEFDPTALASASIGQVHRARHLNGRPLVVKVQHANIGPKIHSDLEILQAFARLAEQHPGLRRYRPVALVDEFSQTLLRELEFGREVRNLEQFRNRFAADPTVCFPEPFPELSRAKVLTMEYLDGVSLRDTATLAARGADLDDLARRGARLFLEMIFRDGFYHADPHPGNLLVLADGRIGVLDCGMVGVLDEGLRESIEQMLMAVVRRDATVLTQVIARLCSAPLGLDYAALSVSLGEFVSYYGSQPLDRLDLGGALTEMTEIVRRHELVMPSRVSLLLKVLVMLEGTGRLLSPRFSLMDLIAAVRKQVMRRRLSPRHQWRRFQRLYGEWAYLAETLPRALGEVVDQVRAGRFDVHLDHRRLQPSVNRLVFGIVTSALFLGSVELWSRRVPPLVADASVLGVLGCAVSVCLGFVLLRAIHKSGDLD